MNILLTSIIWRWLRWQQHFSFPCILVLICSCTVEEQAKLLNKTRFLSKICNISWTFKGSMQKLSEVSQAIFPGENTSCLDSTLNSMEIFHVSLNYSETNPIDLKRKSNASFWSKNLNIQHFLCTDTSCESQTGRNPAWINDTVTSILPHPQPRAESRSVLYVLQTLSCTTVWIWMCLGTWFQSGEYSQPHSETPLLCLLSVTHSQTHLLNIPITNESANCQMEEDSHFMKPIHYKKVFFQYLLRNKKISVFLVSHHFWHSIFEVRHQFISTFLLWGSKSHLRAAYTDLFQWKKH